MRWEHNIQFKWKYTHAPLHFKVFNIGKPYKFPFYSDSYILWLHRSSIQTEFPLCWARQWLFVYYYFIFFATYRFVLVSQLANTIELSVDIHSAVCWSAGLYCFLSRVENEHCDPLSYAPNSNMIIMNRLRNWAWAMDKQGCNLHLINDLFH